MTIETVIAMSIGAFVVAFVVAFLIPTRRR